MEWVQGVRDEIRTICGGRGSGTLEMGSGQL